MGLLIALAVVLVVVPLAAIYVVMRVAIAITLGTSMALRWSEVGYHAARPCARAVRERIDRRSAEHRGGLHSAERGRGARQACSDRNVANARG